MHKIKIISVFFCLILIGCSLQLYMPESPDPTVQQKLLTGRKLYIDHCGSCHNLHFPHEYDEAGWQQQLDKMEIRAKITEQEKQLILIYLTSQPSASLPNSFKSIQ